GIGDPDLPTPRNILDALHTAAEEPVNHRYPESEGLPELRQSISDWYERRFETRFDPQKEALPLIGSKEGIGHMALCFIDPGDIAIVPDPGYPVYEVGTILAHGEPVLMPLTADNSFMPDLTRLAHETIDKARVMWLNYPSNPTAACVDAGFFERALEFCRNSDILLAHDAAYTEITYDGYVAPSVLQADGAMDHAIEFHSLSKTYNMTGWRIGWVAGAAEAIEAVKRLKTNIDSGIFDAVQCAGIAAIEGPQDALKETIEHYRHRRDLLCDGLKSMGVVVEPPRGSIYLWVPVPDGHTSESFTTYLLDEADIVVAPGIGYGPSGEGFVRFSLTIADERLEEGVERLRKIVT
ncbi:MAG: LL-diaminopimelate aminotransferase, partial [Actinomycetota bacterium]